MRFIVFKGIFGVSDADEKANEWLEENPDVEIVDYKYCHQTYGNHSICILYKHKEKNHEESSFNSKSVRQLL